MNKILAAFCLLGTIVGLGLSQRHNITSQSASWTGTPVGEPRNVRLSRVDKVGFMGFGIACACAGLYFVARIRDEDTRKRP